MGEKERPGQRPEGGGDAAGRRPDRTGAAPAAAADSHDGGEAPATATPPADAPAEPPASGPEGLAAEVGQLRMALASAQERLVRARADYDNLSKRVHRDAALERDRNKARVLEAFIPLLELAHMAAHQAAAHPGPLSEGVQLLAREFDRMAEREGLQRIGEIGEPVQTDRHEVVAREPVSDPQVAAGHVCRVVQPGYRLGDRILRFAKVCVASPQAEEP